MMLRISYAKSGSERHIRYAEPGSKLGYAASRSRCRFHISQPSTAQRQSLRVAPPESIAHTRFFRTLCTSTGVACIYSRRTFCCELCGTGPGNSGFAMGDDREYGAMPGRYKYVIVMEDDVVLRPAICLRVCYAMSGTEAAYCATRTCYLRRRAIDQVRLLQCIVRAAAKARYLYYAVLSYGAGPAAAKRRPRAMRAVRHVR
eukprot:3892241-Rhodomonas_salina.7